jgi:hypothetical protein
LERRVSPQAVQAATTRKDAAAVTDVVLANITCADHQARSAELGSHNTAGST